MDNNERKKELFDALSEACSKLAHIRKLAEDNPRDKVSQRVLRLANYERFKNILDRHRTNQIIIKKDDESTLTCRDIRYRVLVKLLTEPHEGILDNTFSFNAASQYCDNIDDAYSAVARTKRMLDYQGIEYEIVDET